MSKLIRGGLAACVSVLASTALLAQGTGLSAADAKEMEYYRLTMETVKQVHAATRAMIDGLQQDPDFQKLRKLQAEIAALEAKEELTDAETARLETLEQQREALEGTHELNLGNADSLDGMEAAVKRSPVLSKALASTGLAPREYAKFMMAMIQASITAGFKKAGMLKELPAGVNPENVKFVEEHEAELRAMQAEFEKLLGKG